MSFTTDIDRNKFNGLYSTIRHKRVRTVDGILCFGRTFGVDVYESVEEKLPQFETEFMMALDNTVALMIYCAICGQDYNNQHTDIMAAGISIASVLHQFPEGGLPPAEFKDAIIDTSILSTIDINKVVLNVLCEPMVLNLAQLGAKKRVMLLTYFNIELLKDEPVVEDAVENSEDTAVTHD